MKKKIIQLKQSPLLAKLNPEKAEQAELSKNLAAQTIRRKALDTICDLKISDPRKKVLPT